MKKFLQIIFNIFWVILVGFSSALYCIGMGIGTFVTIIPIFFGIPFVYFKVIPLVFAPAGKKVVLHFGAAPVRNVIWLIFGGLISAIGGYALGLVLCCTVIGIPLGLQQFKFAKYFLAPFKAEVVSGNKKIGGEEESAPVSRQTSSAAPAVATSAAPAAATSAVPGRSCPVCHAPIAADAKFCTKCGTKLGLICPSCGASNPQGAKFCVQCAAKLTNICPSCGTNNPLGTKFCAECGKEL